MTRSRGSWGRRGSWRRREEEEEGHGCRPQIWIPEIEYYQKISSHAQIESQGAEKQQSSVNVGGGCRNSST